MLPTSKQWASLMFKDNSRLFSKSNSSELRKKAAANLRDAISYVWRFGQSVHIESGEVEGFINAVNERISKGFRLPGEYQLRRWSTANRYPHQVQPPELLIPAYKAFCAALVVRLHAPDCDHKLLAAWITYELEGHIHPFTRGNSQTAKLISAWAILQAELVVANGHKAR